MNTGSIQGTARKLWTKDKAKDVTIKFFEYILEGHRWCFGMLFSLTKSTLKYNTQRAILSLLIQTLDFGEGLGYFPTAFLTEALGKEELILERLMS